MSSIQLGKNGMYSLNIPSRLAKSMKILKGENCIIRKGKKENEILVVIERE
jgi:hypothetical protein